MKKSRIFLILMVFAIGLNFQRFAEAQTKVSNSVFGNGGAIISNDNNRMFVTVGQSITGQSSNESIMTSSGFWYPAIKVISSVEQLQNIGLPKEFRLDQNFPNPFNPTTTIQFALPKRSEVSLRLFDILGRVVATLVDEELQPGEYKVVFEPVGLPSGMYFYRIQTEGFVKTMKLMLLK